MAGVIPLIALIGATASGKSAVALELAQRLGGELLSVDSMQVYRGMDIGTAKPSRSEQALVRHHMIDLVEPTETFTVSRFVQQADRDYCRCQHPSRATDSGGGDAALLQVTVSWII